MSDQASDPDELILNLLRRDDPAAVSLMFHAHYKHVYNGVRKIVRTDPDAQDIAIQLFQAVWEKRHTLNITTPIRKYLLSAETFFSIYDHLSAFFMFRVCTIGGHHARCFMGLNFF